MKEICLLFISCVLIMGNEQSTPAPRGPRNKLSKPRTNSSVNTPNSKTPGILSRRNSQAEHVGVANNRYSTASVAAVVGEAGERRPEENTQRKRRSLFRSKSAQPNTQQLDIGSGVNIEYLESPTVGWSRTNSVIEEPREQRQFNVSGERYESR